MLSAVRATNLLQRLYRPLLDPLGLTYSQYLVMLLLWERGSATVGELRTCLALEAGTISPLLKRMEHEGLVTRRRDDTDERRVIVMLSARGRGLRAHALLVPRTFAEHIGLTSDDGAILYEAATKLVARLRNLTAVRNAVIRKDQHALAL